MLVPWFMQSTLDSEFLSLEHLALELATGGKSTSKPPKADPIGKFLKSDSGENGLTCEQAMSAHCSQKCTNGALALLKKAQKR